MFNFGNQETTQFVTYQKDDDLWYLAADVPATSVFSDDYYCKSLFTPLLLKGKTVLDLGSNIGFLSKRFMEFGCQKIVAYEADPKTYKVCEKNLENFSKKYGVEYEIYNYAVSDTNKQLTFYVAKNNNVGNSVVKVTGRNEIIVNTKSFKEVVKQHHPDIIKCNIEAGEYYFNWDDINDECQILAIELHKELIKNKPKEFERMTKWLKKNFHCYYYKKVEMFKIYLHDIYVGIRRTKENRNFLKYLKEIE
jgi:FkbM family methyltransferase